MYGDEDSESGAGWISWFCDLEGHEFFVEVRKRDHICMKRVHGINLRVSYVYFKP